MEWLVAALTIVFGIVSIALWINYCSVGENERHSSQSDINAKGFSSAGEGDSRCSSHVCADPTCDQKEDAGA